MKTIAIGYFEIEDKDIKNIEASARENVYQQNYDILQMWYNKSADKSREVGVTVCMLKWFIHIFYFRNYTKLHTNKTELSSFFLNCDYLLDAFILTIIQMSLNITL